MNKKTPLRIYSPILMMISALALAACGGGGGGGAAAPPPGGGGTTPPPPAPLAFTVSLESIDVRRSHNGEPVTVDTTGVTSGTLTIQ